MDTEQHHHDTQLEKLVKNTFFAAAYELDAETLQTLADSGSYSEGWVTVTGYTLLCQRLPGHPELSDSILAIFLV